MIVSIVLALALSAPPDSLSGAPQPGALPSRTSHARKLADTSRRPKEIDVAVSNFLRREPRATDEERSELVRDMCQLYREIGKHPLLVTNELLQDRQASLRVRLRKIQKNIEEKLARVEKTQRKKRRGQSASDSDQELLAEVASQMAVQMGTISCSMGGAAEYFSQAGAAGGAATRDNGRELVELIQATIVPDFWDVNGGLGTIVYYAPLQALVVRATGDVHGNVREILGGLRDAGK